MDSDAASLERAGLPLSARQREQRSLERIAGMGEDYKVYSGRAAKLLASGRQDDAFMEMKKFYHKYEDQLKFQPPMSAQSMESAGRERVIPPLRRSLPPAWAAGSEPYEQTPSIFDLLSPPGQR